MAGGKRLSQEEQRLTSTDATDPASLEPLAETPRVGAALITNAQGGTTDQGQPSPTAGRVCIVLAAGLVGIGVLVRGGWEGGQILVVLIALGSGAAYAGVVIGLRVLRGLSPVWLTVVNHLFSGLVLLPLLWGLAAPTWGQLVWLC